MNFVMMGFWGFGANVSHRLARVTECKSKSAGTKRSNKTSNSKYCGFCTLCPVSVNGIVGTRLSARG